MQQLSNLTMRQESPGKQIKMLIPGCCFPEVPLHQVWGMAQGSAFLSLGDLMRASSDLTLGNSIYSIKEALEARGARGCCWEIGTTTSKALSAPAALGAGASPENAGSVLPHQGIRKAMPNAVPGLLQLQCCGRDFHFGQVPRSRWMVSFQRLCWCCSGARFFL